MTFSSMVAYVVLLFFFESSLEVLFQTSFIEKARVTNAVLFSVRFSLIWGDPIGNSRGALALGACIPPRRPIGIHSSRNTKSHTLSWFPIFGSTELCPELPVKSWPLSFSREQICIVLDMEAYTQDRTEHLTAVTGHIFEEVMVTCHPPGIAGDVAETSSNTQCAFRQKIQQWVRLCRRC